MKLIVSMAKVIFFLLDKCCIAGNFCSAYYRVSLSAARFWCCTRKTVVGNTWNWDVDYIWPCWRCNVQKSFWAITFLLVWVFWDDWAGNFKTKDNNGGNLIFNWMPFMKCPKRSNLDSSFAFGEIMGSTFK